MKPAIPTCRSRGGRSQKTGKRVGSRHRWNGSKVCIWCGSFKDDIFSKYSPAARRMIPPDDYPEH